MLLQWDRTGQGPVRGFLLVMVMAVIVTAFVFSGPVQSQRIEGRRREDLKIDEKTREAIIDSVVAALHETYVFPDVAEKIENRLRRKLRKHNYRSFKTLEAFTRELTNDFREVSSDGHMWVRRASAEEIDEAKIVEPTKEDIARRVARQAYNNFGFEKVERLGWNIGYLKFNYFANTKHAGDVATAAIRFLANCDAVIIDLRDNGGGSPSMVQLISSYFLEESTHLNSFYIRKTDEMKQFWSYDHVPGRRMENVPLYILTSERTFSGAEEFTYNMRNLERATIIGETTGGGAHPTERKLFADLEVLMSVPFGRAVNPITETNWEGTGVEPHIKVSRDEALEVARLEAMKALHEKAGRPEIRAGLEGAIARLEALRSPAQIDPELMKRYEGVYGPRRITLENGKLFYQREGRPRYEMIAISDVLFCFREIDYFRLKVELDEEGNPDALVGLYDGGHTDRTPRARK
ncbi:MAG: S41 family peptidase [bacterium]|nr:MAG: S41 family peptidase [bacterium]